MIHQPGNWQPQWRYDDGAFFVLTVIKTLLKQNLWHILNY